VAAPPLINCHLIKGERHSGLLASGAQRVIERRVWRVRLHRHLSLRVDQLPIDGPRTALT
jgi:hypothetical protein